MRLFLGCVGSQAVPGCLTRDINLFHPHVTDTGPENGNNPGVFGPDIEGSVNDPGCESALKVDPLRGKSKTLI